MSDCGMTRSDILQQAEKIVCGDRDRQYGSPEDSFRTIAELWTSYLRLQIRAEDVAAMMELMKLARIARGKAKADNWVDLAGYAACGGEIQNEKYEEAEEA